MARTTITGALEKVLGNKTIDKVTSNGLYKCAVDGVAMNTFSLVYALNEMFIGGMTFGQAMATRGAAAIGNTLTGRPYGIYNDWMRKKFLVKEDKTWKNKTKKYAADVTAFVSGQTPLYALYLLGGSLFGGALQSAREVNISPLMESFNSINWDDLKTAAIFLTAAAPFLGTPQKMTYDFLRYQFGVKSYFPNSKEAESQREKIAPPIEEV